MLQDVNREPENGEKTEKNRPIQAKIMVLKKELSAKTPARQHCGGTGGSPQAKTTDVPYDV